MASIWFFSIQANGDAVVGHFNATSSYLPTTTSFATKNMNDIFVLSGQKYYFVHDPFMPIWSDLCPLSLVVF